MQRLEAIGQITSGTTHDFNNLLSHELTNARLREPGDQEGLELKGIPSSLEQHRRTQTAFVTHDTERA